MGARLTTSVKQAVQRAIESVLFTKLVPVLFAALVAPSLSAHASAAASPSDEAAIAAYRAGDLAGARAEWLAVLDDPTRAPRGPERGRILYDLGNVAYRSGKTLEAVGWYTAALQYRPRDADTWANLEEARSRARLEPADRGDLSGTTRRVLRSFTREESGWLAASGLVLLAGALAFEALRGGRLARWTAIGAAFAALLLSAPWIDAALRARHDALMVIEPEKASVWSEPREKAAVVAELQGGDEVERLDELPDWTKVRTATGVEGWMKSGSTFALRR
jgi:hypothetical protein